MHLDLSCGSHGPSDPLPLLAQQRSRERVSARLINAGDARRHMAVFSPDYPSLAVAKACMMADDKRWDRQRSRGEQATAMQT